MLLNVFKSCSSVRTVLKNIRLSSYLSSASGITKKKRNVWFLDVPRIFKAKTPEEIESLRIVPEGYKLIYLSKDVNIIALARAAVFLVFGASVWTGVQHFNQEYVPKEKTLFTNKEASFLFFFQTVILYTFVTRHVYYIFRYKGSYKTVYYGLFGKLQPRIIDHQAQELVTPNPKAMFPFFFYLKGKPVIISLPNFLDKMEQSVLVKFHEPMR